jgi:hypothetical protein
MIASQVYDIVDRHFGGHDFNAAHQEVARQLKNAADNLLKHSAQLNGSLQQGPHHSDIQLANKYASQLRTTLHQAANQRLIRYDSQLEEQITAYQSLLRNHYSRTGMSRSGPELNPIKKRYDIWQQIKDDITQDFKN